MNEKDLAREKKTAILLGAVNVLATSGLQSLSFQSIADKAGLSRQLVRYYYPDLDELMIDMCDHLAGVYRDMLVAGVVKIDNVQRLDFFLDFFFDLSDISNMPDKLEVYDAMVAYSVGSERLQKRMCDHYWTLGQVMVHELAIAHPELDGHACEEIAYVFVSLMHTNWSFIASLGYSREHSKLARNAMDSLIASYVAKSPAAPLVEKPWRRS